MCTHADIDIVFQTGLRMIHIFLFKFTAHKYSMKCWVYSYLRFYQN